MHPVCMNAILVSLAGGALQKKNPVITLIFLFWVILNKAVKNRTLVHYAVKITFCI